MRIVIDLQSCQGDAAPAALALAQLLARGAGAHQLWIALSNRCGSDIEAVRHALSKLLAREHVLVYDLPATHSANMAQWRAGAAELIRENFLATLAPDLVLVPYPCAGAWATSARAPFATVLAVPSGDQLPTGLERVAAVLVAAPCALPADGPCALHCVDFTDSQQLWKALGACLREPAPAPAAKPRLAYISPLPPEHSGIADYSAELIPELARFYDVELVVDQASVEDARLSAFPLHPLAWFEEHGGRFERVLYHFGNSGVHKHMFELIRRHPGIVVLHDFYLSGVLDNLERDQVLPLAYMHALYESHGYTGLLEHRKIGRNPSIWKYPLNKGVLDHASGVIVHSEFARQLAVDCYGADSAASWRRVPLLRGKPGAGAMQREDARRHLGLASDDFVITSFGMLGRTKLNDVLLDAFLASPLAANPRCKLVFVGENDPGSYGRALRDTIAASGAAARIGITGFVSAGEYAAWLSASDSAVQLRAQTRGETSAAVLDCLLYGVPTVINAHGASAEIGDEVLYKLPDAFEPQALGAALARLQRDGALRDRLSAAALAHMQAHHTPQAVGQQYVDAIEHFAHHSAHSHYRALLESIGALEGEPADSDLADAAHAIAANQPPRGPRQLLVDVSAVVQSDIKTGIQRVVRSVLLAMIAAPPAGFRIEPVYSHGGNRSYQYARRFTLGMVGEAELAMEDAPIEVRRGDVFLGLDLFTNGTSQNQALLQDMRDHGVGIYFVVFDILPMLRPDVFPFGTEQYFGDFLRTVAKVSDGIVCISRAVADELAGWIGEQSEKRLAPLKIGYFHLGADIDASAPSFGLPPDAAHVFDCVQARPSFLMVGTLEPRKGHAQALAAFELLWAQGAEINLVIVGKQGWMVDALAAHMKAHPERDRRLFWLPGVSDEMLLKLYAGAAALLAASEGEGFGLPLIEAAQHNIPIIARDLPVFREVAGEHAYYFDGLGAEELAATVHAWLGLRDQGKAPQSTGMPWLTWSESAQQLLNAVLRQQWYKELPGS
ncbi:MAG: glycosyltransferase [Telluria sp.]|nr:glycosyltransferase [Telluria sp.]